MRNYVFLSAIEAVQAQSALNDDRSAFYFVSPSKYAALICKSLAEEIGYEPERVQRLTLSSILLNAVNASMPEKYRLKNPDEFESVDEETDYFDYFNKYLSILSGFRHLGDHTRIISQVWEKYDGTGLPNNLPGDQIAQDSQILTTAFFYLNGVYRIDEFQYSDLKDTGKVSQTAKATKKRHEDTIKEMYKSVKKFEPEVFDEFHAIIKLRTCPALIPVEEDLALAMDSPPPVPEVKKPPETEEPIEEKQDQTLTVNLDGEEVKVIEKEIPVEELEPGMITSTNVATNKGILVVRQDNRLTPEIIKKIKQLAASGSLSSKIAVQIPAD